MQGVATEVAVGLRVYAALDREPHVFRSVPWGRGALLYLAIYMSMSCVWTHEADCSLHESAAADGAGYAAL